MVVVREPLLHPVAISDLRPTQITVGMREVRAKQAAWRQKAQDKKAQEKAANFLGEHMIPVILGLKKQYYVIDHHHLCRALHEEGQEKVLVTVIADLHRLEEDSFWFVMDNRDWLHPFDEKGRRCGYDALPATVMDLVDDPYRSLAGELRYIGGFAKDTTPFSEFLWADFLRRRIKRKRIEGDFESTLEEALQLAKSKDADYLPGWCGASAR